MGDESWSYSYALPAPNVERNEHVFFGQTPNGFFLANTVQPHLMITFTKSKHNYVIPCTLARETGITVYVPCDYMAFTTDILLLLVTYHMIK